MLAPLPVLFRRRIEITSTPGRSMVALEDDFHTFRAIVTHDGATASSIRAVAVRYPWSTCPGAIAALQRLVGAPLDMSYAGLQDLAGIRTQCTHLFDVVALAIVAAARGQHVRRYDADVVVLPAMRFEAVLRRDAEPVLEWRVADSRIVEGEHLAGVSVRRGFVEHVEATLPPDLAEAARVLRRCLLVANGRRVIPEQMPSAADMAALMGGACHTFQSGVIEEAQRMQGYARAVTLPSGHLTTLKNNRTPENNTRGGRNEMVRPTVFMGRRRSAGRPCDGDGLFTSGDACPSARRTRCTRPMRGGGT